MEKFFDLLSSTPLFAGINQEELSAMLGCMEAKVTNFRKGDPVFLEGDPAGFIGVVLSGSIQILRDDYYGNRTLLAVAEQGDIFAEAYACANVDTMPISGYAAKDSQVMILSCKKMMTVCTNGCRFHNQLVKNLLQVVAQKNLILSRKIQFMSQKTTRDKLMLFLLEQAKRAGSAEFTISFDRQALADFLGVERSAMSAELSKLRNAGILKTKGSWFRLLRDPEDI